MKSILGKEMKKMNNTFKLGTYGELVTDKILFEANYPILFTCKNEKKDLFICVCCQNNAQGKKWLLTRTTEELVISMLRDDISIREVFLSFPECRISIYTGGEYIVKEQEEADWGENSIFLPKKNEFMEAEPGEFDDEIDYYQKILIEKRKKEFDAAYNKIFSKMQSFSRAIEPVVELLSAFPDLNSQMINSQVMQTLKIVNELHLYKIQKMFSDYCAVLQAAEKNVKTFQASFDSTAERPVYTIGENSEDDWLDAA